MDEKKVTEETVDEVKETEETVDEAEETEEANGEEHKEKEDALEETEEGAEEDAETAEKDTAEEAEETEKETEDTEEKTAEEAEDAETEEETAEEAEGVSAEASEETDEDNEEDTEETEEADKETEESEDTDEESEDTNEESEDTNEESEDTNEESEDTNEEAPIIKKKMDKTNVIVIVVAAVVVAACLLFVAFKSGWIKAPDWGIFKEKGKQTIENYDTIEVLKSDVEVSDETVQQYISSILQSQSTTKQIKEGVVKQGDQLNIDFVGKLVETGKEFQGGSAKDRSLTIGSGMMIDGFESGLIGAEIGSTKTIQVTFPENYQEKSLAGKPATFDVTINYKNETVVPELTDEFVQSYSANYLEKQLNTVAELEQYVKDYLYNYYLHSAMFAELQKKQTVTAYDEDKEEMLMKYSKEALEYYAAMNGTEPEKLAAMYGMSSVEEYAKAEAHQYLDSIMLVDQIIKDKNITWTQEQLDQSIALYMARNGYSERYTLDEFKEESGETWLYLYENLEFKFDLAMEALEPNVKLVDKKSEPETPAQGIEQIDEQLDQQESEDLSASENKTN